ncbi:FkbM family methyltransferase [Streptomyces lunalinharesii]|uniref:FkbM family methyltransferase n=2 Tax=Streptomyces lunalinharesii TaxID=333384 RepID=A0ABN3SHY5_9ACTN
MVMSSVRLRPPPSETHLVPPPWTPLLLASRWWVRHGWGLGLKRLMLREWLDVGLQQNPRRDRVVRTRYGFRVRVGTTEDLIQRSILVHGCWEPHVSAFIAGRLTPGAGLVDVGANVGYYSLLAAQLVGPQGRVVAVEPAPDTHAALRANLDLNGFSQVRTVRCAVTAEPGEVRLFVPHAGNVGATSVIEPERHTAELRVPGLPMTEAVTEEELRQARIIKIDVEGAEGTVLASLVPLLDDLPADCEIVVEVSPDRLAACGTTADEVLAPFLAHGLHPYRLVNSYMPEDYPVMLRRPRPPVRVRGPVTEQMDLVLSRVDAEALA